MRKVMLLILVLAVVWCISHTALAASVAYWRMEGDGVTTPTPGSSMVMGTNGRALPFNEGPAGIRVMDSAGNGNSVWAWDEGGCGERYENDVPAAIVPGTGAANTLSIKNNSWWPAAFTWSLQSNPTVDVETIEPLEWTIEASFKSDGDLTGNRTFVGRDGLRWAGSGTAPLYFSTRGTTLTLEFTCVGGVTYTVQAATALAADTWYNVAGVSDGNVLKLYYGNDTIGYDYDTLTLNTGTDNRFMYDWVGSTTSGDTQWSWTVGRGRWSTSRAQGDGHVDRWIGWIDEVRISDVAKAPVVGPADTEMLFVPEPAAYLMLVIAGGLCLMYRRFRKK
jgi:hypothetical protein